MVRTKNNKNLEYLEHYSITIKVNRTTIMIHSLTDDVIKNLGMKHLFSKAKIDRMMVQIMSTVAQLLIIITRFVCKYLYTYYNMNMAINLCYIIVNRINLTINMMEFRFGSIYCNRLIAIRLDIHVM